MMLCFAIISMVASGAAPASIDELMKRLDAVPDMEQKAKTFELAASLGKLYYSHARYAEAVKYLDQAVAKSAAAPAEALLDVEGLLANAHFILQRPAEALAVYDRMLKRAADSGQALFGRAMVRLDFKGDEVGSLRKVKADFERFLKTHGESPRAAQAKTLLSRVDKAIAAGGIGKLGR